jgi:hypothetical protein
MNKLLTISLLFGMGLVSTSPMHAAAAAPSVEQAKSAKEKHAKDAQAESACVVYLKDTFEEDKQILFKAVDMVPNYSFR